MAADAMTEENLVLHTMRIPEIHADGTVTYRYCNRRVYEPVTDEEADDDESDSLPTVCP